MALYDNRRAAAGLGAGGRGVRWRLPLGSRGGFAALRTGIGLAGAVAIRRVAGAGAAGLRCFA